MTLARLAPRLAQGMEGNVLVVDANFRNPDMARWLAVAPAWRLPDVLAGAADWATAVQTTAHAGVSLLPGGTDAQGRGPAGMCKAWASLLRELAGHYDLVVVDASSLAHRGTVQLAAVCDATYLVVRLGEGSPADASRSGPGRPGTTAAGCWDAWPFRSDGSLPLHGSRAAFCYAPHVGPGRLAPFPAAFCYAPPWLHVVR